MLDPALQAFVQAEGEAEADRHLEAALERVTPLLRNIAARKLSSHGGAGPFREEDIEDVVGDAVLLLVKRLRAMRRTESDPIGNLEDYAAAVAHSLCAQLYRLRHPGRARLKNRIRYALESGPGLALWVVPGRGLHCGLSKWRSEAASPTGRAGIAELIRDPALWPESWTPPPLADRADPAPLARDIFERVGGPVELDELVNLTASIWKVDRVRAAPSAYAIDRVPAVDPNPEETLDRKRFAERLWAEIGKLPVRQRIALLLNLRDGEGAGMLWLFPAMGVASLRAIAATLELSSEEFGELWGRLPLDDRSIAERLGCERQQVINLRMSAKKRLANRLGAPDEPRDESGRGDNLGRLSASLGGKP
jgi:RNA polymerase sigma factor (sigma-70 family)